MEPFGIAWQTLLERGALVFAFVTGRYVFFAGMAFLLVWFVFNRRLRNRRIQPRPPRASRIWAEFGWSLSTMTIFALVGIGIYVGKTLGYTKIYTNIQDFGWAYLVFSLVAVILFHDFYFYVIHRFMHWRPIFKHVHHVHHRSTNPSPWAAFAFHPIEGILEAGIVPLVIVAMPLHPIVILAFLFYMTAMNVLGHLGYELFPKRFARSVWTRWHNTAVHHNQHHEKVHCNYSLYFNWWDRIFRTMHTDYEATYDRVLAGERAGQPGPSVRPTPPRRATQAIGAAT